LEFFKGFDRAQRAYENMSDDGPRSGVPSNSCNPISEDCPFWNEYQETPEREFCLECIHFIRYPEGDSGTRRTGFLEAFICEKDCMDPEIYHAEVEPITED
jgi:hypothetical protein